MGTMENDKQRKEMRWETEEGNEEGRTSAPPGLSRELARKNLKPEGHIIQNQELHLIVGRPSPTPSDE